MFDLSKCSRDKDGNYLAQTRDGRPVTIISTHGREPWTLIGYVGSDMNITLWRKSGKYDPGSAEYEVDIINIPEPKRSGEVWVNIHNDGMQCAYPTKAMADEIAQLHARCNNQRIACFSYKWTEGEGKEGK